MAKRRIWFEFSWWRGVWPVSSEGWTLWLGSTAVCLALLGARELMQASAPGSGWSELPLILIFAVALVTNYLTFTHMQPRGEVREDDVNHTARRLFGRRAWVRGLGGGRPPKPLVPNWPPTED